ncbi:hypothetical protein B0T26DRAFT_631104 [Lasiosphaeria miniovina]|uniref:MIP18 family-like domain-containing protein n=1 Tax=Lasiosphaeria miniovina TaxID=1954250 RepID=A0AA40BHQ0_9PEZI|nr:uncharacterized protein B0T26DRAFT_631104 [Lasiosphaeria miniovina]KAK0734443.1 hypothetical protein B0T26DRAFT_631104 [Lasiosphaeria miniovina]
MQKSELDNANPTILSVSQLPSRRATGGTARHGPDSKYDYAALASLSSDTPSWHSDDDIDGDYGDAHDEIWEAPVDEQEIYDLISTISDPEHPNTLGELNVVRLPDIRVTPAGQRSNLTTVLVDLTPTVNHCSLATVIGLAVRWRLEQALPPSYRVDVRMKDGSHAQDDQVNKQLGDKERVAAALENDTLRNVVDKMLETCA